MDRNDDGDVLCREFLGPRDQFDRLDRDNDGLIDPEEAKAGRGGEGGQPAVRESGSRMSLSRGETENSKRTTSETRRLNLLS